MLTIQIEKDDRLKGRFMVVFRRDHDIIGIPLRGVTKDQAATSLDPLKYAFEYGLHTMADRKVTIPYLERK